MQPIEIRDCELFAGFADDEYARLFEVIAPSERSYGKGETIIADGARNFQIRVLVDGEAFAVKQTFEGGRSVYARLTAGSVFGGVIAVSGGVPSAVTVYSSEASRVASFDFRAVTDPLLPEPSLRMKLLVNITASISKRYFALQDRIDCITRPTLREKVLTYLMQCRSRSSSRIIYLPFNREQMAEYLNADRTALSRELSQMQNEGIIEYWKNSFRLFGGKEVFNDNKSD